MRAPRSDDKTSLADVVAALESDDDEALLAGLRVAKRVLDRAAKDTGSEAPRGFVALGARAVALLDRRSPRVRQAVAEVADVLPDLDADRVLAALLADGDHYVQRAAERASARRKKRRTAQALENDAASVLAKTFARLESRHGKPARRLAEQAVRLAQRAFVKGLHHELAKGTIPLEAALYGVEHEAGKPAPRPALILQHIERAKALTAFSKSVLKAALTYGGPIEPAYARVRLAEIVDEARRQLETRKPDLAGRLAFTDDVSPTLAIEADRDALLQALHNVLDNAAEAHDATARVEIGVAVTRLAGDREIALVVTDKGRGMTKAALDHVYVAFGSSKPGGTGVGVITARRMIEEVHHGSFTVTSAPHAGTTVTMVLPLRAPA